MNQEPLDNEHNNGILSYYYIFKDKMRLVTLWTQISFVAPS